MIAVEERESLEEVMNIHPDTPLQIHREDCWPPSISTSTSKAKAKATSSAERLGCKRMMIQSSVKSSPCTPLPLTVPTQVSQGDLA